MTVPRSVPAVLAVGGQVVPDKMFVKLRTTNLLTFSSSVTTDTFVLMANSAFDPFQAEGSLQPQGFDEWAAFYGQYRVWDCAVTVRAFPFVSTTDGANQFIAIFPSNASTIITTDADALSHPFVKWRIWGSVAGASVSTVTVPPRISHYRASAKQLGYSNEAYEGNNACSAVVSADPARDWFWHIYTGTTGTNIYAGTIIVELIQTIEFFDRSEVQDFQKMQRRMDEMKKARAAKKPFNKQKCWGGTSEVTQISDDEWDLRSVGDRADEKKEVKKGIPTLRSRSAK